MKKFFLMFLTLALVFGLCACGNNSNVPSQSPSPSVSVTPSADPSPSSTEVIAPVETPPVPFTAPTGTVLCGVDLSEMTVEEAAAALNEAAATFTFTLNVSGVGISIPAESVSLALNQDLFADYWAALENGSELPDTPFSVDRSALESLLAGNLNHTVKNPTVSFSNSQGKFVVTPGISGMGYDTAAIAEQAAAAMCSLTAGSSMDAQPTLTAPSVSDNDPRLSEAAEQANQYLTLDLSYTFTAPDTGITSTEQLTPAIIGSLVNVSGDYTVSISSSAVNSYAMDLGERYRTGNYNGPFITTGGKSIAYSVKYYGVVVDCDSLAQDIYTCLTTGVSGVREATYLTLGTSPMPYGGSYIEIDLTGQQLWVYKNGECVVTTPIVSGCVADGNNTPIGVFSIYKKAEDAWLVGPTWRDHVDYWMPFYGAYGLHDASWRDEFGGDIYIHEGSHGCPNLPVEIAGQVYHNISVGTPVIIYGGATTASNLTQEITGTTVYDLSKFDEAFPLDVALKYSGAAVTYTSDNEAVATVSADGIVTLHSSGVANITVSAAAFTHHTAATLTIQVNVSDTCREEHHVYGEWSQVTAPTCDTAGSETSTCTLCGHVGVREIPATGHSFAEDGTCANGCGTTDPTKEAPDASEPPMETPAPEASESPAPETSEPPVVSETPDVSRLPVIRDPSHRSGRNE